MVTVFVSRKMPSAFWFQVYTPATPNLSASAPDLMAEVPGLKVPWSTPLMSNWKLQAPSNERLNVSVPSLSAASNS